MIWYLAACQVVLLFLAMGVFGTSEPDAPRRRHGFRPHAVYALHSRAIHAARKF